MIAINNVQLSKAIVDTLEVFLLTVEAVEELAYWLDVKTKTWDNFKNRTYEDMKLKIF